MCDEIGYGDYWDGDDSDSDEGLDLGPCCACGLDGVSVRSILMLPVQAPVVGHGWGCLGCNLPNAGAVAVVCDMCIDLGSVAVDGPADWSVVPVGLQFACRGWPGTDGRIPIDELYAYWPEFRHRPVRH